MVEKAAYLYDDFTAASGKWWSSNALTGVVSAGLMRIRPTPGYDTVGANLPVDLTDSYLGFKLVQNSVRGLGSNTMTLTAKVDNANYVEFVIGGGRLLTNNAQVRMREHAGGVNSDTTFTYDPAVHVWFRLRERLGVVHWETSVDGAVWSVRRSRTTSMSLSSVDVLMIAGYWDAEAGTTFATIDDFNLSAGVPTRPKLETLTDTFDFAGSNWDGWDANNTTSGGRLAMVADNAYHPLWSSLSYDLTGSALVWEVAQNLPRGNGTFASEVSVCLGEDLDNRIIFSWDGEGGYGLMIERVAGVNNELGLTLDPQRHRWFRIRESAGTVYWDTSGDGAYWVNRRSVATGLDLTACKVRIYTGYYGAESGPAVLYLDNVGLPNGNDIGPDIPLPIRQLTDTFDIDNEAVWSHAPGWEVTGGQLVGTPTVDYEWAITNESWNREGSENIWQLVQNANPGTGDWDGGGSVTSELWAGINTTNRALFLFDGGLIGDMVLRETNGGVHDDTSTTYNADLHKWLRIREADGTLYWEGSPNGVIWSVLRSKAATVDYTSVKIGMVTGYWDNEPGDLGHLIIDNINLPDTTLGSALGWQINSGKAWGGVRSGTIRARHYFQDAEWLWGQIPDNPVLEPYSAEIGAYLAGGGNPNANHSFNHNWYGNTIVFPSQITDNTPRYDVLLTWPIEHPDWELELPFVGYTIPIPRGTQVPPGSDGHLVVMDPTTGKAFGLWQARYDSGSDSWSATYGGIADLQGDGRDYLGSATASELSRIAGVITLAEVEAGEIPHALFLASNMCRYGGKDQDGNWQNIRYPATKSDGDDGLNLSEPIDPRYLVDQGTRIQLDPSIDLNAIPNLRPIERAVGRAMQKYGGYIGDKGGAPNSPPTFWFTGELWQGQDYTGYDESAVPLPTIPTPPGYRAAGVEWDYVNLDRIPWAGNIRVLRQWDGG